MTMTTEQKAAKAGAIRAALLAGNTTHAYALYDSVWATNLNTIPEHLRDALVRYVLAGGETGGFLTALLQNDLMDAVALADPASRDGLRPLCIFLYNHTPKVCRGSFATMKEWRERHGALGVYYDNADLEDAP